MQRGWISHAFRTSSSYYFACLMASASAWATEASRASAGQLPDGTAVEAITLSNDHGVSARILTYGATLQSFSGPDRDGKQADILLGYDDLAGYLSRPDYFGVTVGRYANRIGRGRFTLDGQTYQLPLNDKGNTLHGGGKGFDKQVWKVVSVRREPRPEVVLSYSSPNGEAGYPGQLATRISYALDESGGLTISYEAKAS